MRHKGLAVVVGALLIGLWLWSAPRPAAHQRQGPPPAVYTDPCLTLADCGVPPPSLGPPVSDPNVTFFPR